MTRAAAAAMIYLFAELVEDGTLSDFETQNISPRRLCQPEVTTRAESATQVHALRDRRRRPARG